MAIDPSNPQCSPQGTHVFIHGEPIPAKQLGHPPGMLSQQQKPPIGTRCQCGAKIWTEDGAKPA